MSFTDQVEQTVERIIDAAIDYYMTFNNWNRAHDGTYVFSADSSVRISGPGRPDRTEGGQVTKDGAPYSWDFEFGSGPNAGSLVYGHWEQTIRDLFYWWSALPEPANFDPYIDNLRDAAWAIQLPSKDSVSDIGNAPLIGEVDFLEKKIGGDDMNGRMILTFDQDFCSPLPTVVEAQYAVVVLAGATLCGERQIWVKARQDVLEIADKLLQSMKDHGSGGDVDISTITALISIATVFEIPGKKVLTNAGTVLQALGSLFGEKDAPTKPKAEFKGGSPAEVVASAQAALKTLAQTIRGREDDLQAKSTQAMHQIQDTSASFRMPKPKLLDDAGIGGMKVDLEDLDFLATNTLPKIEKHLEDASDNTFYAGNCSQAWYRAVDLGVGNGAYGPYDTWAALNSLAEKLTADLAWETKSSAQHLAIAAEQTGRTEAEIEASMRKHAAQLSGGSGYDPIGDNGRWLAAHP